MNIQDMIGPVDVYSAAVLVAFGAGATIIVTTALARTPRKKMEFEFQLANMKQQQEHDQQLKRIDVEHERDLGKIAANKQIEITRIESGMIDVRQAGEG
jgi:hypothetical protein